jgi:hypothetical protein
VHPTHGTVDRAHGQVHGPRHGLGGAAHRSAAGRHFPVGIRGAGLGEMEERPRGSPSGGRLAVRRSGRW